MQIENAVLMALSYLDDLGSADWGRLYVTKAGFSSSLGGLDSGILPPPSLARELQAIQPEALV